MAFSTVAESYTVILIEFGYDNECDDNLENEENYVGPGRYRDDLMTYIKDGILSRISWVLTSDWSPRTLEDTN